MNENKEELKDTKNKPAPKEDQKSLQSDDQEVLENRRPKEGSAPISDAGKKREEGRRYQ